MSFYISYQNGATALMIAAQKGHVKVVKMLHAANADVNLPEKVNNYLANSHNMPVSTNVASF